MDMDARGWFLFFTFVGLGILGTIAYVYAMRDPAPRHRSHSTR